MGLMGLIGRMGFMGLMVLMGQMGFMRVREPDGEAQGTAAEWGAMGWMLFVGWWGDLGSPFCVGFV